MESLRYTAPADQDTATVETWFGTTQEVAPVTAPSSPPSVGVYLRVLTPACGNVTRATRGSGPVQRVTMPAGSTTIADLWTGPLSQTTG